MERNSRGADFIKRMSAEALGSIAVNHPYLRALREGDFPDMDMAFRDFAFQYGSYSERFTRYVSAVIENLDSAEHKRILLNNLAEEQGATNNIELPPDVLASVAGQPHTKLFRRFQEALGINAQYRENTVRCQTGLLWSKQFLQLCKMNECVGVGAIGIGTELIVSSIYNQILQGLEAHSNLTMAEHVFFNLHSECDEAHAAQIAMIAEDLAIDEMAFEQIEYGVKMAINMRVMFWDKMLERARKLSSSALPDTAKVSAVGY
jgi:pyrroloquinoline quinone (PQQ) biosynthesis protein C